MKARIRTAPPRIPASDSRRARPSKKPDPFYLSPAWRSLRLIVLKRDRYRCVVCGISIAGKGKARVDHIKRIGDGGAPLDPKNVRSLCVLHDAQSHREKGSGRTERDERFVIQGSDASGKPLDPGHPWNR